MKKKITVGHILIIAILVVAAVCCLYPVWYTLVCSFSSKEFISSGQVWIWPKGFHLLSYQKVLEDSTFLKCAWVSIKRVLIGCTINIVLLVLTAYPLAMPEKLFPAGKYVKWYFIFSMFVSGGLIPTYMLMNSYGLMDSFWALIIPGAFPIGNLILMINFFRQIPYELYEAANIDGANPLHILFKIYFPLSKPSIACMLLYAFVGHWNSYFDGLLYINNLERQPLQTYIYQLNMVIDYATMSAQEIIDSLKTSNDSFNAAKVFIALLPIICVYPFLQKYFTKGMVLGAVKG